MPWSINSKRHLVLDSCQPSPLGDLIWLCHWHPTFKTNMLRMDNCSSLFVTLFFCAILLLPLSCHGELPENHAAFFIFGDSLLDSGNNLYLNDSGKADSLPYGETFFKHSTGRLCDGRIVPDFICKNCTCILFCRVTSASEAFKRRKCSLFLKCES